MAKVATKNAEFIKAVVFNDMTIRIVGTTPLIMHRFARKAWQELLYPSGRKNEAERSENLKHNPLEEFRECFYRNRNPKSPTLFHIPNGAFHGALSSAALDIAGATKTKIERLTKVGMQIDVYGIPSLYMAMVRNSDMNRTPDVRTRPVFSKWCCELKVSYMVNPLTDAQVLNLLGSAGQIVGIGDWRPQKAGDWGCFKVVNYKDAEYAEIVKTGGRVAQQAAYDHPDEYDEDSAELLAWFNAEVERRRQPQRSAMLAYDPDSGAKDEAPAKGKRKRGPWSNGADTTRTGVAL